MKKIIFLFIVLVAFLNQNAHSQNQLKIRAWEVHDYNIPYLQKVIDLTPQFDITHIVFSHSIVWYSEELLNDARRGKDVNELAARAHRRGLKAWVWTHEINGVPEKFIKDGKVLIDEKAFWDWEKDKYRTLFTRFKNLDGLVLTFHETTVKVYDDNDVISKMPKPARVTKLINSLYEVCQEFGKDLTIRTFAYEPNELEFIKEGMKGTDPAINVQSKVVPHEWDPFYPHNPLIGQFPERKEIIEFHSAAEIGGYNMTPYPHPEYFKMRMDYGLSHNAYGYMTRIDVGGHYHALGSPNELNIYTLYRLAKDPSTPTEIIWKDWSEKKYGKGAAPFAISALKRAFDISNKTYYTLEFWITDHTKFPSYNYAEGHISSRTIAKWNPDPKYKKMENDLNNPYPRLLEQILSEKDEAIALCRESLADLEKGKEFFERTDYEDLKWRFTLDLNATIIWKYFNEAFFGYKILVNHKSEALKDRIIRAVNYLERWASINEYEYGEDIIPGNPTRIRNFVAEMRSKLEKI